MDVNTDEWAQAMLRARKDRATYPSALAKNDALSLDDAYSLQRVYVDALVASGETVSGFKAALTATAAQASMGIDTAIVGALLANGDYSQPPGTNITIVPQQTCLLETEIGLHLAQDVHAQVTSEDIPNIVDACMPMIEIASPNLSTKPSGIDLVATNSASLGYVMGPAQAPDWRRLDNLAVSLSRGDERLLEGNANDVLGGQQAAAAWLINTVLEHGYTLTAGALLMTGSIGGIAPALPGDYSAAFGELGEIGFSVEESE